MTKIKTLYQKAKTGKIHFWRGWTENDEVVLEHGTLDGKSVTNRYTAKPTNVGKKNERNGEQQALFEVESQYKKKLDGKYCTTIKEAKRGKFLPMRAKRSDDQNRKDNINFPARVQRKYNGLRCMADWRLENIYLMSRGNKQYHVKHIEEELAKVLPKDDALDGELYKHQMILSDINSLVKKWQPVKSEVIEYHVYDYPIIKGETLIQSERLKKLEELKKKCQGTHIVVVESYVVNSWKEIEKYAKQFEKEGYEGAIVRDLLGMYEFGYTSDYLLKVKSFKDDEFEVVDYDVEIQNINGRRTEAVVWLCKNKFKSPDGTYKIFEVRPKGTFKDRAKMLKNVKQYIGKKLTVKYFELTKENIPFHGVGLHFRIEEDLPVEN
jgi:DNA ligase-1